MPPSLEAASSARVRVANTHLLGRVDSARHDSQQRNDVVAVVPENPAEVAGAGLVGVSPMDLLEETEMETGFEVSSYRMSNADYEDVNEREGGEEKDEEEESGLVEPNCCMCMVGKNGAAFIPCRRTFFRTCCGLLGGLGLHWELPSLQQFHFGNS